MRYAISYVSTADRLISKEQVQKVLNWTQKWNNGHQITGILLYSEGNFFQVLEGKKEILQPLFSRIKADARHHNIITLFEQAVFDYKFKNYKTDFIDLDYRYQKADINTYFSKIEFLNPKIQDSVRYILNKFTEGIK